ncbi:galactose-1-phosphate uridylyltransferase [bacterium]|nr:galactose-1-phosphate uridylyltransferase [bacterium]
MAELRQNMVTKEWVIIAPDRALRPDQFRIPAKVLTHQLPVFIHDCPFCPGNESETPADLMRWPESGPWKSRLFPNKFPALSRDGERVYSHDGVTRSMTGVGYHEVLIETRRHNSTPGLQSPQTILRTLNIFIARGRQIAADPRIEQVYYFKNHGPGAGTSIIHPHCQLLALPMVPFSVRARIDEQRRTYDEEGVCPICATLDAEIEDGRRIVSANDKFVAFVPYAALSPFHMWIVPRRHGPSFLDLALPEVESLAALMREVFGRLYYGLNDPDYNYIIRSAPQRDSSSAYLHWYISIMPRVTRMAGFELGSGMSINPTLPVDNAEFLRGQDPGQAMDDDFEGARLAAVAGDGDA